MAPTTRVFHPHAGRYPPPLSAETVKIFIQTINMLEDASEKCEPLSRGGIAAQLASCLSADINALSSRRHEQYLSLPPLVLICVSALPIFTSLTTLAHSLPSSLSLSLALRSSGINPLHSLPLALAFPISLILVLCIPYLLQLHSLFISYLSAVRQAAGGTPGRGGPNKAEGGGGAEAEKGLMTRILQVLL